MGPGSKFNKASQFFAEVNEFYETIQALKKRNIITENEYQKLKEYYYDPSINALKGYVKNIYKGYGKGVTSNAERRANNFLKFLNKRGKEGN